MSLQNPVKKMSKSDPDSRASILVTDAPTVIRKKIMSAKTDITNAVSYDPKTRPGVSNLVELLSLLDGTGRTPEAIAAEMDGQGANLKQLKENVADVLVDKLDGIRQRYSEVMEKDEGRYVDHVQERGAKAARESAAETMRSVRDAVGL
jgi:tryptophanyl-tRNA synthetase